MGAMYRLKAYFGMVPADEMGEYDIDADDAAVADRFPDRYSDVGRPERPVREYAGERWDDRFTYDDEPEAPERFERFERERVERPRYDDDWDRRPPRPMAPERARPPGPSAPSAVRGALAIDQEPALRDPAREPLRPVPAPVPEQRERVPAAAPTRITTLQPGSYREARTIGEHYRAGQPVIMNLTELDAAEAKRLVDFAAGLVFALHGGFDKVTNRVFLLTPANVEVSADDARKLAERGILRAD